jgi:hypothetical protein
MPPKTDLPPTTTGDLGVRSNCSNPSLILSNMIGAEAHQKPPQLVETIQVFLKLINTSNG